VVVMLPVYVATVRKMQALAMLLGEVAVTGQPWLAHGRAAHHPEPHHVLRPGRRAEAAVLGC
jgi:hypothetical protein